MSTSSLRLPSLFFAVALPALSLTACGGTVTPGSTDDAAADSTPTADTGASADTTPSTDATSSDSCGGASGRACRTGSYCHEKDGVCGEGEGLCEAIPTGCGKNLQPTCGCNGVTYDNPCLAAKAGMNVLYDGACTLTPPTDKSCGGFLGTSCNDDEYCDYEDGGLCGGADAAGTCRTKPTECSTVSDPVCGCDGKGYANACMAHLAGSDDRGRGACAKDD